MFDQEASLYDEKFTNSKIGIILRQFVWDYIDSILPENNSLRILELNCGTGEDAVYLAKKGHQILATDISGEMIRIVEKKVKENGHSKSIKTLQCDIKYLDKIDRASEFDLIFSNFGGLNCLDPHALSSLSTNASKLLKTNGRFIAVVMTNFCLWESFYFLTKLKFHEVFRRFTKDVIKVRIGESEIDTWFYSPKGFYKLFNSKFNFIAAKPIGLTVPPSYLEPFFASRNSTLKTLKNFDIKLNNISILARIADHFLIDMKNRNEG